MESEIELISYSPNDHPEGNYLISYSSLRDDYQRYAAMSNKDFSGNLLRILHFTCITCWLKEEKAQHLLSDTGLVHEIVHLLLNQRDPEFTTNTQLSKVREMFRQHCALS